MSVKKSLFLLMLTVFTIRAVAAKELPLNYDSGTPFLPFITGPNSDAGTFDELSDKKGWCSSAERIKTSPDGRFEAEVSEDRAKLQVRKKSTREVVFEKKEVQGKKIGASSEILWSFCWSPDSETLVFCDQNGAHFYQLKTGIITKYNDLSYNATGCDWSKTANLVAILGYSEDEYKSPQKLQVYDWVNKKKIFEDIVKSSNRLAWSPDGKKIAINQRYAQLKIYNSEKNWSAEVIGNHMHKGAAYFAWSPDSTKIAVTKFEDLRIYDVRKRQRLLYIKLENPRDVSWSADGKTILCRYFQSNNDYYKIDLEELEANQNLFPSLSGGELFSKMLNIFDEPCFKVQKQSKDVVFSHVSDAIIYRYVACSSFKAPICVKVEIANGKAILQVKKMENMRNDDVNVIEYSRFELDSSETEKLKSLINKAKPQFEKKNVEMNLCEGTHFLLELCEQEKHFYIERWPHVEDSIANLNKYLDEFTK